MFVGHNSKFHFSILFIYQIHNDLDHHFHLFRAGFGDHQRQGDEGVIADQGRVVGLIEDAVALQKPQE